MKKQMFTLSKLCATALSIMLAFHPLFAQAQKPNISVSIFRDLVRFTAPTEVQAIRVEVVSSTGEKVFEGSLVDGQTQDWPLQDLQGQTVDSGVYSYTITVKDQAGVLKDIQQGNLIIDRAREGLEPAPPPPSRDANSPQNIKPNPTGSWDVDRGKDPYIINTPAMGIGTQTPLSRLHVGAGTTEPITKGSTLILEEGEATGMVLKNTIGAEMFFSQDKNHGLFGTASNHPLGVRTNNLNRLWITGQGNVGIGTINPSSPLTVAGVIETTGGIKFSDGTIQTTAANASSDNPPIAAGKISKGASQNIGVNQDRSSAKKGVGDKTVSPEFSVNEDLTVNGNIIFTPALSRDITMAQNTGGIRIFAASALTGQPSSAAIQFFGTGHGGFPGQAYIDSGAHDAAAVIFRTAPTGGTIAERMRVTSTGNVGIGNSGPSERLSVGGRLHIAGNCGGVIPDVQGAHITWNQLPTGNQPCGFGETDFVNHQGGGPGGFAFINRPIGPNPALSTLMFISGGGNVGVGTTNPDSRLTVAGDLHLTSGAIKFADGSLQTTRGLSSIATDPFMFNGSGVSGSPLSIRTPLALSSDVNSDTFSGLNTNVNPGGIGVYGQADRGSGLKGVSLRGRGVWGENMSTTRIGDQPGIYGRGNVEDGGQFISTAANGVFAQGANYGAYVVGTNFGVYGESNSATGFGGLFTNTAAGGVALRVNGQTSTSVLKVTGGSDLSEQFDINSALDSISPASIRQIEPGLVVSIDPSHPGALVISSQPYDQRVAGIISGAGGVKTGMLMSQDGSIAAGSYAVALSGRVYCWADASKGPIKPGDVLTTSDIPGYAMKVTDHEKAHGSIIGKAMTELKQGKGLVLVLVALQ